MYAFQIYYHRNYIVQELECVNYREPREFCELDVHYITSVSAINICVILTARDLC